MTETDLLGDPMPESRMRRRSMDIYMMTPFRGVLTWPPPALEEEECDQGPPVHVVVREMLVWFMVVASIFALALWTRT